MFYGLKGLGCLRVSREEEELGLDINHHGGKAYHYMKIDLGSRDAEDTVTSGNTNIALASVQSPEL